MHAAPGITTSEAAAILGVHRTRVNKLIQAGLLPARKVGTRFLIDPAGLDRRLAAEIPTGRPLSPRNAWALLALASNDPAMTAACVENLLPSTRSRVCSRLRRSSILDLAPRLRSRATVHRLRADPDDIESIKAEPSLLYTGTSAAAMHGFDIAAPGVLEAYVPKAQLLEIIRKYFLEPSARSNLILHVPTGVWPFPSDIRTAPPVVVALDLLDGDDARTQRAGREALEHLGAV